jgi:hypothetical protein
MTRTYADNCIQWRSIACLDDFSTLKTKTAAATIKGFMKNIIRVSGLKVIGVNLISVHTDPLKLTSRCKILLEKLTAAQQVKKYSVL